VAVNLVGGYSGCHLILLNNTTVRKISSSVGYNDRLKKQSSKQSSFNNNLVKKPLVLGEGYTDTGLYYFDMEYVRGVKFSEFMINSSMDQIRSKFSVMLDFINSLTQSKMVNITEQVKTKIDPYKNEHQRLHDYCLDSDWLVDGSYCHGDLSFANILISGDDIFFIDFLDSFVSTSCIDYSKFLQDILLGWSWRENSTTPHVKNISLMKIIREKLHPDKIELVNRMLVINILRIIPYLKTQKDELFLHDCLDYLERKFT